MTDTTPDGAAATYDDAAYAALQADAKRHLWMHFTRHAGYATSDIPVMVRGEGAYVWDAKGKRYNDGLSGLFVVQVGHGRRELAEAAAAQASTLEYFPIWSYAHPPAIELAAKLASLAPGDLNRVFFTTGGAEAVESAWKLARQYFRVTGRPDKFKIISRNIAYHGTSLGALAITGVPAMRQPYEPLTPGAFHVANTYRYRCAFCENEPACNLQCANDIERMIQMEGPDSVAAVIVEPVQNAGGCITPPDGYFQRVREICDRYDVLMISDEVICAYGRLGTMFGAQRFDYLPDIITSAKGLSSGYSPIGAMICRDFLAEPFVSGENIYLHGFTFAGHPVSCAVALRNLQIFEDEDVLGNVRRHEGYFRQILEDMRDIPIVGDVRGVGYFQAIELVRDQETKAGFTPEEQDALLRDYLSPALFDAGLVCRADDRGEPVVQLAPPLICTEQQFDEMGDKLRTVLTEAARRFRKA
jgi:adenosylmethionine-8-amino-7-oxononanoate aminotransferase